MPAAGSLKMAMAVDSLLAQPQAQAGAQHGDVADVRATGAIGQRAAGGYQCA